MQVLIDADELARLRDENRRLTARVDELLHSNTALVMQRRKEPAACVREFMTVGGQPMADTPRVPSAELVRFRWKFQLEEFWEGLDATFKFYDERTAGATRGLIERLIDISPIVVDLPQLVDSWTDQEYVIEGTRQTFGIDGAPIFAAVHAANMAKFPGGVVYKQGEKIVKPPGWQPADIRALLIAQGARL